MPEIDKDLLKKLKQALPGDGVRQIMARTNLSRCYIDNVLAGRRFSVTVIEAAIEVAQIWKEKNDSIRNEIMELVS